jgi:acyl dehydratase
VSAPTSRLEGRGNDPSAWIGAMIDHGPGDIRCERGYVLHWLEATENANPLFWDTRTAAEAGAEGVAPPTMLSVWSRPLVWAPGRGEPDRLLALHHAMKAAFGLPEGIVASTESVFLRPVREGDRLSRSETVREIGDVRATRLGTGRNWTIDVTYRNQDGDVVGIESYEMFSYRKATA